MSLLNFPSSLTLDDLNADQENIYNLDQKPFWKNRTAPSCAFQKTSVSAVVDGETVTREESNGD